MPCHRRSHCPDQSSPRENVAEGSLNSAKSISAIAGSATREKARHEIQLHGQPGTGLQVESVEKTRRWIKRIRPLGISIDKEVFPRNESILKDQHRIVFIEPAGKRVIERTVRGLFIRRPA